MSYKQEKWKVRFYDKQYMVLVFELGSLLALISLMLSNKWCTCGGLFTMLLLTSVYHSRAVDVLHCFDSVTGEVITCPYKQMCYAEGLLRGCTHPAACGGHSTTGRWCCAMDFCNARSPGNSHGNHQVPRASLWASLMGIAAIALTLLRKA